MVSFSKCLSSIKYCLSLTVGIVLLFAVSAIAQVSTTKRDSSFGGFVPGLSYQVHSLPLTGSQMLGPELSYEIWGRSKLGTRYLLSTEKNSDRRVNVFYKIPLSSKYYHWVIEPHYSYLFRSIDKGGDFSTTGLSLGYESVLTKEMSLGALVGAERTGPAFPLGPAWDRPFLILFTNFSF